MSAAITSTLDSFLAPYHDTLFTAYDLAVLHQGDLVYHSATRPGLLFDFASLTKLFTTTAFLALVSAGKTSLNVPLMQVIPEFEDLSLRSVDGGQDPHSKEHLPTPPERLHETVNPIFVTFWHLLTHTSGLPAWRDVYNAAGAAPLPPDQPDPIPRLIRYGRGLNALVRYPFVAQPGEGVLYSDVGLMLLGEATARINRTPAELDRTIQALVLDPLKLNTIMFNPVSEHGLPLDATAPTEIDSTWRKRRVLGEVHDENACGIGGVAGHAGLFGTALDVAAFAHAWQINAVPGVDPALIKQAISQQAETNGERRGLGWMLRSYQGSSAGDLFSRDAYGHTGFVGNSVWIDPEQDLIVVCLTNNVYFGREKRGIIAFRRALHDLVWKTLCA